ncbi:unnamed protein product [Ixodes persulcatus]
MNAFPLMCLTSIISFLFFAGRAGGVQRGTRRHRLGLPLAHLQERGVRRRRDGARSAHAGGLPHVQVLVEPVSVTSGMTQTTQKEKKKSTLRVPLLFTRPHRHSVLHPW